VQIVLSKTDEHWLSEAHPGVHLTDSGVAGEVKFTASYDSESNLFSILDEGLPDDGSGMVLTCKFGIRIESRIETTFSALPALFVEGTESLPDLHFGADKSACLCSLLEEDEFLLPEFQFKAFFERLVIPFLYYQAFHSIYGRWPWPEYAHFATGLLESYGKHPVPAKIPELLRTLVKYRDAWIAIRAALMRPEYVKGHTQCFCSEKDQIRRCHPSALRGVNLLREDIKAAKIVIP